MQYYIASYSYGYIMYMYAVVFRMQNYIIIIVSSFCVFSDSKRKEVKDKILYPASIYFVIVLTVLLCNYMYVSTLTFWKFKVFLEFDVTRNYVTTYTTIKFDNYTGMIYLKTIELVFWRVLTFNFLSQCHAVVQRRLLYYSNTSCP